MLAELLKENAPLSVYRQRLDVVKYIESNLVKTITSFIKRMIFYPDVPEHEMVIDIYLPIK